MSTIILAEDDQHIQLLIERKLASAGYQVEIFGNGEDALNHALNNPPKLMILDVMLPGISGLDVCQQVKIQLGSAAPAVLILSARGTVDDVAAGEAAGADDYLIKPFSPADLLTVVERLSK